MARARSIKRLNKKSKKKKSRLAFLPEPVQAFLARRFVDIVGFSLLGGGLFTLAALVTYNHGDPSWNTGTAGEDIANIGGGAGAWVSDILLQTLGAGSLLIAAGLIIWGGRILRRTPMPVFWLRIISLMGASLFASIALAQIPSGGWTTHPYLGSSAGTLLLEKISQFSIPFMGIVVPALSGVLSLGLFAFSLAMSREELARIFNLLKSVVLETAIIACSLVLAFVNWLRHYNDPDYKPEPLSIWKRLQDRQGSTKATTPTPKKQPAKAHDKTPPPPAVHEQSPKTAPQTNIPVVTPQEASHTMDKSSGQKNFLYEGEWKLPDIDLIQSAPEENKAEHLNEDALRKNAELLQNVLHDFNIQGDIVSIHPGPVVTLYELEPAPGTKSSKVISISDDIARSMSAVSVRCAVVPGRNVIGIELPNKQRQVVYMQEILSSNLFEKTKANLPLILGKDIGGKPILADLSKMPHLLVAGTTGSGKSVAVNTMILSLLYRLSPDECRFIMIDPKMLELSVYDGIPHLLAPVVTEPGKAVVALKWTVHEMEERYRAMSKLGVRNIEGYNERVREAAKNGEVIMTKVKTGFDPETGKPIYEEQPMDLNELPFIVVIVDEFADLMLVAGKDVEAAIQRLAQMARAAGIHLIMATQRPSVDVITGVVKANFPTRISFSVTSKIDSRTILGEGGAEQLLGMGDMLYMAPGGRITRVHGPFVSDTDVENVVKFFKEQGDPNYVEDITDGGGIDASDVMNAIFSDRTDGGDDDIDELYDQAVAMVAREQKASTSFVQRYFKIGYNRAARIVEEMERQGVISAATSTGKREVLISDYSDVE